MPLLSEKLTIGWARSRAHTICVDLLVSAKVQPPDEALDLGLTKRSTLGCAAPINATAPRAPESMMRTARSVIQARSAIASRLAR